MLRATDRSNPPRDLVAATRRPRRYMIVGLICAVSHNAVMIGCNAVGVPYLAALAVSFVTVTPTAYVLHSVFTFERGMQATRFLRFTSGTLAGAAISVPLMIVFVSGLGINVPVATVASTILMFLYNFVAVRWAILTRSGTA